MLPWVDIYSASISALFVLCLLVRLWELSGASIKVVPNRRGYVKLLFTFALFALHCFSLAVLFKRTATVLVIPVLSDAISIVAALGLCLLSFIEHERTVRPSSSITTYLLASVGGHVVQLTGPTDRVDKAPTTVLIVVLCCLELTLLAVENSSKNSILKTPYQQLAPESSAGILESTFFWWINPILRQGYKSILDADELPPIDSELSSETLRRKILTRWDQRARPEGKATLPLILLQCLIQPFMNAILPRLFLITFRYSQAILIHDAISFVTRLDPDDRAMDTGYWLVLSAIIVYTGMAISTAIYQHRLNRLRIMIRGALVGLIHQRSLNRSSGSYDDGSAVTLMSTDVDSLDTVAEMFHESWAQFLEVIVGTTLLARQIGWTCLVPLLIIFLCSRTSAYVAKHLQNKQRDWNVAIQKRITMTTSLLSSAKSIKMLGMANPIASKLRGLRDYEIRMSKRLRLMMYAYNVSANALGIFSPAVTLVLFALLARYHGDILNTETAFTSIALLTMVTHPANMVMTMIPRAIASLANFERVQHYLLESSRRDVRLELKNWASAKDDERSGVSAPAIVIDNVTIQYSLTSKPILQDINCTVNQGSVVMCAGPVGSGKTTLARAILGEIAPSSGSISISTKILGLCTQAPWLPSANNKEVICQSSAKWNADPHWYETVIHCCGLRSDLEALPEGDMTAIGSGGLNLSGGQRQRVALARAVYARCDILILDDPFSALDGGTEDHIVRNLLGPEGILRKMKTTVFLITNAAQHFRLADSILILGDSTILMQGSWDELKDVRSRIAKILPHESKRAQDDAEGRDHMKLQAQEGVAKDAADDLSRRTGDLGVYGYYFKAAGLTNLSILVCCTASYSFCLTFSQYWLKLWTEAGPRQTWFYTGGYLMISFVAWISTCGNMWIEQIQIAPRSGAILHDRLLSIILGAPLAYYTANDVGVMLNRFGQDIQLVDKQLAPAMANLSVQIFKLAMQAALLFNVQKLMTITLPVCTIIVYIVQKVYLRTSRQLRYMELESRSALYSSFLNTVQGIATIRAFGWQKDFEADNVQHLENSQRPTYLLLCLQRWLNVVLDLMIAGVAVIVIALTVVLRDTTSGAQVGVALNMILVANTTLLRLVERWTTLEISLGAIARLKSVVNETPQEEKLSETLSPSENWPQSGSIEMENVTVSYSSNKVALKNINMKVEAGQKLVICGRTGSGKSTLLSTLLRLLDLQSGSIKVDDVDISRIPLLILRQRCFITIPQDPVILPDASLRFNVDPSESLSDKVLTIALEKTQLWQIFFPEGCTDFAGAQGILDMPMSSLPSLSAGQLQLLALARALLRAQSPPSLESSHSQYYDVPIKTNPILLLDEATSSLDPESESIIQDVIQEEFSEKGHTVIVIAHRLSTLTKNMRKGLDAVVWMKDGRVESMKDIGDVDMSASDQNNTLNGHW